MEKLRWGGYAWIVGGAAWVANALLGLSATNGSAGFYVSEAVWIPVHVLVAVGLVTLSRSDAGRVGLARTGLAIALAGRVVFLVAEIAAIAVADDEIFLLPIAAITTAIGMVIAGTAMRRQRVWRGWARFAPLAMGVYPLVAIFPPFAITGERSDLGVAGWGLTFIAIGAALLQQTERRTITDGLPQGPATIGAAALPSR